MLTGVIILAQEQIVEVLSSRCIAAEGANDRSAYFAQRVLTLHGELSAAEASHITVTDLLLQWIRYHHHLKHTVIHTHKRSYTVSIVSPLSRDQGGAPAQSDLGSTEQDTNEK